MEVLQDTYKDTKIGRIPKDWRVLKFRDIFNFIITSSHSKNEMVYSETDTEIYNVHYGAIHTTYKEQILDFEKYDIPRITDDSKLPREDQFLMDGDLVIVDASEDWGGMGECVELKNIGSKKVIGGLHTFAVRDKVNSFAKGFAGYIFQNTAVRNKLASYANVSKVYGITKGNISNVPIVIPTLPEQQKIAAILSTVDEQISTTDKIIEKSKELKKGLMQKLFSEGIGHTEFKDTKIGRIPKNWEIKKLASICDIVMGQSPSSEFYNENDTGLPLVQGNADIKSRITKPRIYTSQITKISEVDDIIMTVRAPVGAIAKSNIKSCIGRGVCALRVKSIDNEFLYQMLIEKETSWIRLEQGSTFSAVNSKDIKTFKIPFPSLPEQQKIAAILSEADAKIEKEQTQKSQLEQLKKGLMQQLLTGKKRVKV
jgi:type I restriction enzyme, S subunit